MALAPSEGLGGALEGFCWVLLEVDSFGAVVDAQPSGTRKV
jgi:hypothetical protein